MPKKKIKENEELSKISENILNNNILELNLKENEINLFSVDENKIEENKSNYIDSSDIITINDFKKKEIMLYEVLNNFFNICTLQEITMMIEIINGEHKISLRFLDWFVTRYCYLYKLSIPVYNCYNKEQNFNINISYKAQLKSFKKKYFDPFRRKKKFIYEYNKNNLLILTTLGQLNFFRWAISFDIIKYAENNYKTINSKISHVNSYFIKNTIDINSLSISTSEEKKKSDSNDSKNTDENIELNSIDNLLENDIDIFLDNTINSDKTKQLKPSKIFKILKNSKQNYKYPQVSRNECIEF